VSTPSAPRTATPAPPTTPGAAAPPPATAGTRPSTSALQPQDIYQAAYIDFSKGSYALAMAGFREFLRRFPEHPLAGNAQYWIGESHFSLARGHINAGQADKATQEMEQAVQEFRKVLANYPRGEKAPTALYKEALALLDLKQPALAQQRLEYLVSNFPQAEETPLARERLAALKTR
jgi:TolA-binding protein